MLSRNQDNVPESSNAYDWGLLCQLVSCQYIEIQLSDNVLIYNKTVILTSSNMTSFFRFVNKRVSYRLVIISLAHAPVHVTDFPVIHVHVDELSSVRIWQHKMCATLSVNVNINCRLPINVYPVLPYLYAQTYQNPGIKY